MDIGVLRVSIYSEAVADLVEAQVPRNSPEAKDRETAIVVVRLHNLANVPQRLLVLVLVILIIEVKRAHLTWIAITRCVIDGGDEGDLPARAKVINESGPLVHLKRIEM